MATDLLEKIPYEKIWVIPPWQRWLGLFGTIFLFFVIYYFVSLKGANEEIKRLGGERDGLKAEYNKYEKHTKKMPQLEKEIVKLNRELKKARIQLPNEKEIPELLTHISNIGTNAGLEFLLFRPTAERSLDFYAQVPVEMVFTGGYHNTVTFFDKVKNLSRIVDISKVRIKAKKSENKWALETSCTATTYKYLEKKALKTKKIVKTH